jgi:2,4-dienoyl-CoA reductase-like NADH-dependent reductase (Old Yellow Enzyme family)
MNLFTPFDSLKLKNRSVMAPMTRYSCDSDGLPTSQLADYYVRRAMHDTGLIIIESCAVNSKEARGYKHGAQFHSETHVKAWAPIIDRVHAAGGKIWIQLFHAGRLTVPEIISEVPLAPSSIKPSEFPSYWRPKKEDFIVNFQTLTPYVLPKQISVSEIANVIKDFAKATFLAEKAGFDGIEIHGAHGYLIHTFLSKLSNKRTDAYGLEKGYLFLSDLITQCRSKLKDSTVLSFRCSVHMVDNPLIRLASNEIDFNNIITLLDKGGVDVFHSSEIDSRKPLFGSNMCLHEIIRIHTRKPIIVCGAIQSLKDANKLLKKDEQMLIAFGRNFISNPDLIDLFKNGQEHLIKKFEYSKHINAVF